MEVQIDVFGDFLLEKSSTRSKHWKKTISKYFDAVAFPQKNKNVTKNNSTLSMPKKLETIKFTAIRDLHTGDELPNWLPH